MSRAGTRPIQLILMVAFALALCAPVARAADPVVAAVGDMGCAPTDPSYNNGNGTSSRCRQRYVSDLLVSAPPAALLDLGDNQYVNGELANYQSVYHPTFGRVNAVVYPSLGNAEYDTPGAQGFFDYFSSVGVTARIGSTAADASHFADGYYSFDIGSWHLIALNSNCQDISGGCRAGGAQEAWLRSDLAAHPNRCTLAYWHHPRWNSGSLGNDSTTAAFWTDLYNARADIVLGGHGNHHYERFTPQTAGGAPDPVNGVREFIVSTGGESHGTPPGTAGDPDTSEITDYTSFGILRLTLHPTSYDWQFVPAVGGSFTDSGSQACHTAVAQEPGAPALSATADSAAHLAWSAPSDGGAPITGYKLYRGTAAGGETLLKTLGNVTNFDDTAVSASTKYWYRVSALNSAGEGPQSNEVSVTTATAPAPPPPFPTTAALDDFARSTGTLGANWQSPGLADPGTAAIAASGVTKSGAGASSATWKAQAFGADQEAWLTLSTLPANGNFIQVAGRVSNLTSGSVSCYFLRVTPSTGRWELRKKVNGALSTSIKAFTTPFAAGDSAGLQIVGPAITAYRRAGSGGWTAVGSVNDTAITAGGYLSFTLGDTTARGGAFGGGNVAAQPSAQPPAAPVLAATADTAVHLSWNVPADGGAAITGYRIYRGTAAGAETLLKTVGAVTDDDTSAVGGTTYYYRVAAVNGAGEGALSNEASAKAVQAPAAPSLAATADTAVHLSWNVPADGGAAISAYKLYRGTSAGGQSLLTTLGGTATSYDDGALSSGTAYYYRVSAVNAAGEGAASNEVTATPSSGPPPPLPFPRTAVLDDFARPAGTLGANWRTPGLADPGTVSILSSGLTKSGSSASSATWSLGTFGPDQEAYLTVPVLPANGNFIQVAGRVSNLTSGSVSCYFLRVTPSTGLWVLRKKVNGALSTSIKAFTTPFAAGDAAGLQIIGSTLTAYRKAGAGAWTAVGSAGDTAISGGGYASFTLGDTTVRGGAFGGGTIAP